jgi:LL-diaminopimelate aminotransferase
MQVSKRIEKLPPYLFVDINKRIQQKRDKGIDIISFAIGDPDIPTQERIIDRLCDQARKPENHRYPETDGLPELRQAIADWYKKRFSVALNPATEVLPLIGSKEGIGHISFCYLDTDDVALVPDPSYPVYSISTMLAGGVPYYLPINEKNNFIPDIDSVPANVLKKAKILWLNYPNNPTGAIADLDFFKKAVKFAHDHNLIICHDAPYTEVSYDGYKAPSFIQVDGAREVAIEFHSCSKTYNMTGWRIGMAVGNANIINALFRLKSNLDSGIPQAIQQMAIEALNGPQDHLKSQNMIYQNRRDKLIAALKAIGLQPRTPKASFYIWVKVPDGYSSIEFTTRVLEETDIAVTPGTGYGAAGEGYIRLSLTLPDKRLNEAIKRLNSWHI